MFAEVLVFVFSVVVAFLYSWIGLAYAMAFMVLLSFTGLDVNAMLSYILLSQATVSPFAAIFRSRFVVNVGLHFRESVVVGLSALAAFLAALVLGVRVSGFSKLVFVALLLIVSSVINILNRETHGAGKVKSNGLNVLVGVVVGFLKGVFGSGALPVLIGFQRLLGLSVDETVFRIFITVSIIAFASSIPYILNYGFEPAVFLTVLAGSLLGVFLSKFMLETKYKRELLTASMLTLATALILNFAIMKP